MEKNQQSLFKKLRSKDERRLKALYILLCLVVLALLGLLGIHAILVGPGSVFWDLSVAFFAIFSGIVFASGVIFPIVGLCAALALPFIFFAWYLRHR